MCLAYISSIRRSLSIRLKKFSATYDFSQATMLNLFTEYNMEVKSDHLLNYSVAIEVCCTIFPLLINTTNLKKKIASLVGCALSRAAIRNDMERIINLTYLKSINFLKLVNYRCDTQSQHFKCCQKTRVTMLTCIDNAKTICIICSVRRFLICNCRRRFPHWIALLFFVCVLLNMNYEVAASLVCVPRWSFMMVMMMLQLNQLHWEIRNIKCDS